MPLPSDVGVFDPGPPFQGTPERQWTQPAGQLMVYDPAQDSTYDALVIRDMQTTLGAYWKMQEGVGATSLVSRGPLFPGNNAVGTCVANAGDGPIPNDVAEGFTNRAWRFKNGTSPGQGITLSGENLFPFAQRSAFTLECWIKQEGVVDRGSGNGMYFLQNHAPTGYRVQASPTGSFSFQRTGADLSTQINSTINTSIFASIHHLYEWVHYVATYDGATMRQYVNGQFANSSASSASLASPPSVLLIGGSSNCLLSRVAVYGNIVLTAQQILDHYSAGQAGGSHVEATPVALPSVTSPGRFFWIYGPVPPVTPSTDVTESPTPGGATAAGFEPVVQVATPQGGATGAGQAPSPQVSVPQGGAVGQGFVPTAQASVPQGGAVAAGQAPTASVTVTAGGAVGQGQTVTTSVPVPQGGSVAAGQTNLAVVTVTAGSATAGGFAPTDGGAVTETPTPGGATAAGVEPAPQAALTLSGATGQGVQVSMILVPLDPGGAVAAGNAPDAPDFGTGTTEVQDMAVFISNW